jgi:type I restriction enzyme M protein
MINKKENALWDTFNNLSRMDISDFKDYILSLLFYKYLSEKNIIDIDPMRKILKEENIAFSLKNNFSKIEQSNNYFINIYSHVDLFSSKLERTKEKRENVLENILSKIDSFKKEEIVSIFDTLLGKFAQSEGKNSGDFYTPPEISTLLSKLISLNKKNILSAYDPTCGTATALLKIGQECEVSNYYGQEMNPSTYNLARMNMVIHGINYKDIDLQLGDTLEEPKHLDKKFEAIISIPPFNLKWSADEKYLQDKRFIDYGTLAPKSRADFAFIQHSLYHLEENGVMATIITNGVLFRGGAEGEIRKQLIKNKNYVDAIISLPSHIFYNTSIPVSILVFKKNRKESENILFIDASTHFTKQKNQNYLTEGSIEEIIKSYKNRSNIKSYSSVVQLKEIERNNYNLSVPQYIQYSNSLNSLRIKNFKSLTNIKIDNIPNFSVFAGSNGSGKSNLFEALEFIRDVIRYGANEAIKRHNGYANIASYKLKGKNRKTFLAQMEVSIGSNLYDYEIRIENLDKEPILYESIKKDGYELAKKSKGKEENKITIHKDKRFISFSKDESILKLISDEAKGLLEFLSSIERYQIDPIKAKEADDYSSTDTVLDTSASNLSTVLKSFEKDKFIFQDIIESMQIIVPEFEKISTQTDKYTNKSILLFKEGGRNKFPAGLISDGTIYALAMLTIIYSNTKGIVLIEEPERGLNPKAISELMELFREKSESINIFINTHNETIVRESNPNELFLVAKKDGKTEIKNVKESFPNYDYSKMEIDKMWLCNMFDGGLPW